MNRGRRAHVHLTQLFDDPPTINTTSTFVITRGRNTSLLLARNTKIAHRYYFKSKLQNKNYDTLLQELELEFDICKKTIYNILFIDSHEVVMQVMRTKPTVKDLRKMYIYFNW
jgi:hypothetical protein